MPGFMRSSFCSCISGILVPFLFKQSGYNSSYKSDAESPHLPEAPDREKIERRVAGTVNDYQQPQCSSKHRHDEAPSGKSFLGRGELHTVWVKP